MTSLIYKSGMVKKAFFWVFKPKGSLWNNGKTIKEGFWNYPKGIALRRIRPARTYLFATGRNGLAHERRI